ncbi:MAG TPA: pseudaminic acid cytidylyltransferase, partial [Succinivibrio sp.]|nr:pseudaminic acid cytidylyltransferase [Succinivibrio sp.]
MNNIAVIPARGGSKRIPLKNIKDFNGAPLISYSIKAALDSGVFSKVIVSSDDKKIIEVATQ